MHGDYVLVFLRRSYGDYENHRLCNAMRGRVFLVVDTESIEVGICVFGVASRCLQGHSELTKITRMTSLLLFHKDRPWF